MRRRLLAQLEGPVAGAYAAFGGQLRAWLTAALAGARFAVHGAGGADAGAGAPRRRRGRRGDLAGVAADLAQIEKRRDRRVSRRTEPAKGAGMIEGSLPETAERQPASSFNRSTLGAGLASLFSDTSHELATAVLPAVLLRSAQGRLLWGGSRGAPTDSPPWQSSGRSRRRPRRKTQASGSAGYLVTAAGVAAIGLATQWWHVLLCRVIAWIDGQPDGAARRPDLGGGAPVRAREGVRPRTRGRRPRRCARASPRPGAPRARNRGAPRDVRLASPRGPRVSFDCPPRRRTSPRAVEGLDPFSREPRLDGVPFRRFLTAILIFGPGISRAPCSSSTRPAMRRGLSSPGPPPRSRSRSTCCTTRSAPPRPCRSAP